VDIRELDVMGKLVHDVDVKALQRIAVLHNLPTACNLATADLIISSPLFQSGIIFLIPCPLYLG